MWAKTLLVAFLAAADALPRMRHNRLADNAATEASSDSYLFAGSAMEDLLSTAASFTPGPGACAKVKEEFVSRTCPDYLKATAPAGAANVQCAHPSAEFFCPQAWEKHEECLQDTTPAIAKCDAFVAFMEAEMKCSLQDSKSPSNAHLKDLANFAGRKTMIFWSGAGAQAESLGPRINAFVLNSNTPYASLMKDIPTFSMASITNASYVRKPQCDDWNGYGWSLNPWTAASRRFASYLRDGDTALVLLGAYATTSVFSKAELPEITSKLARPLADVQRAVAAPPVVAPANQPNPPQVIIRLGTGNGRQKFKCNNVEMATAKDAAACVGKGTCGIIQEKLKTMPQGQSLAMELTLEVDCDEAYTTCPRALRYMVATSTQCDTVGV